MTEGLHFEDWAAAYGSPYLIDEEAPGDDAALVEPLEPFARTPEVEPVTELAFVDGVRRIEGLVYHRDASGALARGVVGAHASGAVVIDGASRPAFHRIRTRRLLVFGSGHSEELARVPGYAWETHSVRETDPEAPVRSLQDRMRMAEARLAEELALEGWLTLVDGPIYNVRTLDQPVLGYIKTHLQRRLPVELHARVPELAAASARRSSSRDRVTPRTFGSPCPGRTPAPAVRATSSDGDHARDAHAVRGLGATPGETAATRAA